MRLYDNNHPDNPRCTGSEEVEIIRSLTTTERTTTGAQGYKSIQYPYPINTVSRLTKQAEIYQRIFKVK